ncbi:MAG: hypothetical protein P9M13_01250 [Candidatus Ancaeobacter aquaticus]|nr:hypothetical protein [Candidatus Ancaeobacter aquaticus]
MMSRNNMKKVIVIIIFSLFNLIAFNIYADSQVHRKSIEEITYEILGSSAFKPYTIVTRDVQSYFYADGNMKKSESSYEITYYVEEYKITRTRVYDLAKKEVIPDDTVYHVQKQLSSHPGKPTYGMPPVIRAIGQPGNDAVEILVIGDDFIQSCKSTSRYFVITRAKRIK